MIIVEYKPVSKGSNCDSHLMASLKSHVSLFFKKYTYDFKLSCIGAIHDLDLDVLIS